MFDSSADCDKLTLPSMRPARRRRTTITIGRFMTDLQTDHDETATLEAFVATVQHLPLFTGTAIQLIQSAEREDVTSAELSRLIATDAALVVHLLRLVNSSFYGLSRKIGTVSDAIAILGLDLVRRTVASAVLKRPLFAYLHDTESARAFWRHELICAALARHLARGTDANGELAYMAGLLHDVGRLVMLTRFPDQADLLLRGGGNEVGTASEREVFGFTHAQVGAALLESWDLPAEIVQAARHHTDETEPDDELAAAVWRANLLSYEMEDFDDDDEQKPWMAAIGLSVAARHKMIEEIEAIEGDPD
jgi:putative nucleotidyltransferase with HDIG domain